ncbi:MAG: hypothetical protein GY938_12750 [Ketobacter sp.]|nr:hypothetical protein [Ketobacter sp.]
MAATANSYAADQGEIVIEITVANVAAVTGLTTAESITLDVAIRKFEQTGTSERTVIETKVTGSDTPIVTAGTTKTMQEWTVTMLDDYSSGGTGEVGTDTLSVYEIFRLLFDANQHPGSFAITPNGGTTGDIEYTLVTPVIKSVPAPTVDADNPAPVEVAIVLNCPSHTTAAHA